MLPFERKAHELEIKIAELKGLSTSEDLNIEEELSRLEDKLSKTLETIYANLSAWEKVMVARHSERPHALSYIEGLFDEVTYLEGDRLSGEDSAILGGIAKFRGKGIVFVGQEKGRDVESRVKHNFGMPRPEGYRKAMRLMELAQKFRLPLLTFVDTAGAYPGIDAESRGQAEAIAQSIALGLGLRTPYISVVIGEGGSGGAIAISAGDRLLMLEHSYYSVISPEGASSILWQKEGPEKVERTADSLKLTAQDWQKLGLVDEVVKEPIGGAHRFASETIAIVGDALERHLKELDNIPLDELLQNRFSRYRQVGGGL